MRLLKRDSNGDLSLTQDFVQSPPAYTILSHNWGADDQEVTFQDLMEGSGKSKAGYRKIQFCGEQAALDGLQYFWVDTCCIKKTDPVELQRSINSMFRWYKNAAKCYAYLSDVLVPDDKIKDSSQADFDFAFRNAKWFTRGWTLQELLAPSKIEFFSNDFKRLGDRLSLERPIHEITGIPVEALQRDDLQRFSVEERVSWIDKRETRHEEDMAYSLLGIFGIFLPLIYGEGRDNAFRRLREEVVKSVQIREAHTLPKHSVKNQPNFTVPFIRDPNFVGREDVMQEITKRLERQRRLALCGIGGIGKSQIAIEYCYVWKDRYPDSHIFWVHASTFDGFQQAYRGIAKDISIPGSEDPNNDILIIVRDWLNKPEHGLWLFVLDNADDLDLWFESTPVATEQNHASIIDFLPRNENGYLITTTRDKRIGQRLTDREKEVMVEPLAKRDAEQLLRLRISRSEIGDNEDIQIFVEILGNIPLAISQAAAFIQENSMTVQTYLKELRASDSDLQDYLDESLPDPRRYPGSENSVTRAWKLSFDQIAKHSPRAAGLLSLMVQLDRQAIPMAFLKDRKDCSIEFNKAIGTLQAYSLIKTERGGSSFEVHRLIQLSTQRWLSIQQKQTDWQKRAFELMVEKFPSGHYGTWEECERLILHAKCVARHDHIHEASLLQKAQLLQNIARYEESQGRFEAACSQYRYVLQIQESKRGKAHPKTLAAMNNLALVIDSQGKYAEAEAIYRQTLELAEEVLGKTHPGTLTTLGNLALVLNSQGKYAEADTINRQTLKLREEVLGKMHPDTLTTMNNLAGAIDIQGKYVEAEAIYRQTLKLMEKVLRKTHPEALTTMCNLALVLNRQGKYAEAETINRQTLKLTEEVLGKTHPGTLSTMASLALVLNSQGKYSEAESMNRQTLELMEKVLGKMHPITLMNMTNLALVLNSQCKYAEAETMSRQTLELTEKVLGKIHPDTLASVYCLAYLLHKKRAYVEASILYKRASTGYESSLGRKHPTTVACAKHYSVMLKDIREGNQSLVFI